MKTKKKNSSRPGRGIIGRRVYAKGYRGPWIIKSLTVYSYILRREHSPREVAVFFEDVRFVRRNYEVGAADKWWCGSCQAESRTLYCGGCDEVCREKKPPQEAGT
jgi:hypothetical protein